MKKIIGLDLGTTSIGWAFVHEAENDKEKSDIIDTGVRIVSLTTDEKSNFNNGQQISTNADRTLKRGARRNLQRYKLRRKALLESLKKHGFIGDDFTAAEDGKNSTFANYALRAKAASEELSKEEFARVLFMLNKKRGYKSNRKAQDDTDGVGIDGLTIAKTLQELNKTPGQWAYDELMSGKKLQTDFYRSDLQDELEKIINFQSSFHPKVMNQDLIENLNGKTRTQTSQYFYKILKIELAENKGKKDATRLQHYKWRSQALSQELSLNELAYILTEINNQINQSSSLLGGMADRSKELQLSNETVGQRIYKQLCNNKHQCIRGTAYYRQDYEDEFDTIWKTQAKYLPELNDKLKHELKDIIIFYQRRLKSQKHLVSDCEFEKYHKAAPKSSPLFQEFRMWQNINALVIIPEEGEPFNLSEEWKEELAKELNWKDGMTNRDLLKLLGYNPKTHSLNFEKIEGNRTNASLLKAYLSILEHEGYTLDPKKLSADELLASIGELFKDLGIDHRILSFDAEIPGNAFDKQAYYRLWHLLYSAEENEPLKQALKNNFGFDDFHCRIMLSVKLEDNYASLSAKAIKKILPHLKDGLLYDKACTLAGYNHSSSLTKEENDKRELLEHLPELKKNSLRNPVVEKILNQMINVVNAIMEDPKMGRPDEIRVELARELKANSKQRADMKSNIDKSTKEHENIRKLLSTEFGIKRVTRNDIIRYKLWKETDGISVYTGKPILPTALFSNEYDIEHIIPKARLFDDSFSNKTLCERKFNQDKGKETALSFCETRHNAADFAQYKARVTDLYKAGKIRKSKHDKLLMANDEIPEGFIERQLRESQYIAKKALEILQTVTRNVSSTIGSITNRLREDWELVDIMKELNWEKYNTLGLTHTVEGKNGEQIRRITDWTKRNDHRHHAMDALTVAFTKPAYVQYLNRLNATEYRNTARSKHLYKDKNDKWRFKAPMPNFRAEAKKHLECILISHKAKNKVSTQNKNRTKTKNGYKEKVQLTPRGPLHKESVYGKILLRELKEEKVGSKFTPEYCERVVKKTYREALLKRLSAFDNDPKKAFAGKNALAKKPIYLDAEESIALPEVVQTASYVPQLVGREAVNPKLNLNKIYDTKIKQILEDRLKDYDGKAELAFSNLEENPIWLDQKHGIAIKSVKIKAPVKKGISIHHKKNHKGEPLLDENKKEIASDYVAASENHHIAIFKDDKGKLHEKAVSFFDAVVAKYLGLPIVNRHDENGWEFCFSIKKNECFVFPAEGFNPQDYDLLDPKNRALVSQHLFKNQAISIGDYRFYSHLDSINKEDIKLKGSIFIRIRNANGMKGAVKVRINHIGQIVHIGE